ncbi:MAG: Gfo/Idh/MocA family oxidoreductase [Alphaproteobacteria bacterium]|nr:Gfo/Idh/MocA family oxidoreductase [Alphaproteobacteria bacterium]
MSSKPILVCGAGSIGRRHIENLKLLGADVSVWRSRPAYASDLSAEFEIPVFTDIDVALSQCRAVVVATSTDQHMPIALKAAAKGLDIYLEKPISHSIDGISDLIGLSKNVVVEIGCQLRAHPTLNVLSRLIAKRKQNGENLLSYRFCMGQRLDAWRPGVNYQNGYSADTTRGGGALFDLIHQVDLAQWIIGPMHSVTAELSSYSNMNIRADDLANMLITHKDGLIGHIQVDMLSPVLRCDLEIITTARIYRWDLKSGQLSEETPKGNSIVDQVEDGFERNTMFKTIMQHYLCRIEDHNLEPLCSLEDGVAALNVVLAARESSKRGQRMTIKGMS